MEEPEYEFVEFPADRIVPKRNPSYEQKVETVSSVCSKPADSGARVEAKKPSCDWSWWCVCIGLVVVGAVACVSMAVAVGSIVKVHSMNDDDNDDTTIQSLRREIASVQASLSSIASVQC